MINPWTILGALLLLVATFFGGQWQGKKLERATWQKEKIALQEQHLKEINIEVAARDRQQKFDQAIARKASEKHEKALEELRQSYADDLAATRRDGGLRIPAQRCKPGPASAGESSGASGPDEAGPATEKLPDRIEEGLFRLTQRADELAEPLRALQGWVKDSGFYGPGLDGPH